MIKRPTFTLPIEVLQFFFATHWGKPLTSFAGDQRVKHDASNVATFAGDEIASIHAALAHVRVVLRQCTMRMKRKSRDEEASGNRARRSSARSHVRFSLDYFFH